MVVVVLVIIGVWWYTHRFVPPTFETQAVTMQTVKEEVDVTGTIAPIQDVSLSFEQGGKVAAVPVLVGDRVFGGQAIASLSNSDMYAQLLGAQARYDAAVASLEQLQEGTRPEQLEVYAAQTDQARRAVTQSETSLYDAIATAFTQSDSAVRSTADQMFSNPRSANPTLTVFVSDPTLKNDIEWRRLLLEKSLIGWENVLYVKTNGMTDATNADEYILDVQMFLQKLALAVNALTPNANLSQVTIDTYRSAVSLARTNVNTAATALSAAKSGYTAAVQALSIAEKQYTLQAAPATDATIKAAKAQVDAADAQVAQYRAMLAKTELTAPIDGTITLLDTKAGETVLAGKEIASLISVGKYQIDTYIPEADITKIRVGYSATFTLDAYDDSVVFHAKVVMIDPGETVIEGVATYKVTLQFIDTENKVRSGMSANVTILTEEHDNVLAVPSRALQTRSDGTTYVRTLDIEGNHVERTVVVGLRGSDGSVEILSGDITAGEEVITFEK